MYGDSERLMGKAFQDRRNRVVICSKCRHLRDSDGSLPGKGKIKNLISVSLRESLVALNRDSIDVYMLHQVDPEILCNDTIAEAFLYLKNEGVIRATGVSTYTPEETKLAVESGIWDVIQLPFNLMNQSHKIHFESAARNGTAIVVRSVLFKGILSDKVGKLHPALKEVEQHLDSYNELLSDSAPDLPALAIKFALSFEQVSTVLVGIDKSAYLQKALHAADGNYLDTAALRRAGELGYPDPEFLDLVKWDKKGWLK
jgi:aryl-alcohol dehydrogenase-like predicted oxidoreductase